MKSTITNPTTIALAGFVTAQLQVKLGGNKYINRVVFLPIISCNLCCLKSSSKLNLRYSYDWWATEIQPWIWMWTTELGSLSGAGQVPPVLKCRCTKPFVQKSLQLFSSHHRLNQQHNGTTQLVNLFHITHKSVSTCAPPDLRQAKQWAHAWDRKWNLR